MLGRVCWAHWRGVAVCWYVGRTGVVRAQVRPGLIEADPVESALLVHYDIEEVIDGEKQVGLGLRDCLACELRGGTYTETRILRRIECVLCRNSAYSVSHP
jgi:hypothetical protein